MKNKTLSIKDTLLIISIIFIFTATSIYFIDNYNVTKVNKKITEVNYIINSLQN